MKILVNNFSVRGSCDLFHYGHVNDYSGKIDLTLESGKIYGLIGEFGEGGAAVSYGLAGFMPLIDGSVTIDGLHAVMKDLFGMAWYVGYDMYGFKTRKPIKITRNSVESQMRKALAMSEREYDIKDVQSLFGISDERIVRNIAYVSGERFKASAAIGFALNKKIFCFPWLNSKDFKHYEEQIKTIVSAVINDDGIVVVPVTKAKTILDVCKDTIIVDLGLTEYRTQGE